MRQIDQNAAENVNRVLIGNKADVSSAERVDISFFAPCFISVLRKFHTNRAKLLQMNLESSSLRPQRSRTSTLRMPSERSPRISLKALRRTLITTALRIAEG